MHFSSKHRMLLRSMKHTQLCNTPSSPAQLVTKYWGTGEDIVFNWHWKQGWAELLLRPPSAVFHTHRGSADFDVLNAGGPFWHTLTVWSWKAKLSMAQILKGPFTPTTPLGASVCLKKARKSPRKEPNLLWLHPWPEAWGPAVQDAWRVPSVPWTSILLPVFERYVHEKSGSSEMCCFTKGCIHS